MTNEFCGDFEDEQIQRTDEMKLVDLMDLCLNLYLSHLEALENLSCRSESYAFRNEPVAKSEENLWIDSILSFSEKIFFKFKLIH